MGARIDRKRVKTAVWAFVAAYAALTAYAAVSANALAAQAADALFGLFVTGFGALLLDRTSANRLLAAGSLLAVGGGLALLGAVGAVPGWLADPPVVVGLGLYAYERWLRSGTDRLDPLDPRDA